VRLLERVIQLGAFFELRALDDILIQQLLGCVAAFGPHRINFKNQPGGSTDWQSNMAFVFSHAGSITFAKFITIQTRADFRVSVSLTNYPGL
jgi:hypothetical protein